MKKTFIAVLCLLMAGSMVAQKKAVDKASKLVGKPDKMEEALTLINGAMQNPETANDARTYYVAGQLYWKLYDNIKGVNSIKGDNTISDEMAAMLLEGYKNYVKALELDKVPDAKGKSMKYTKDILNQMGGHDWDFYFAGARNYNERKYPIAYEMFEISTDIPEIPQLKGSQVVLPDSVIAQANFLAGVSAYSSKPPMLEKALKAFANSAKYGYPDANSYIFQVACIDNIVGSDSVLNKQYHAQKMQIIREGFEKYGKSQPFFLGSIIDDFCNDQNNPQAALDFINDAISKNPNNAKFVSMRGYVKGRMKDDKGYLEDNLAAAAMPGADAEVYYDAARASYRYGQAQIGVLGIGKGTAEKRAEYIKQYIHPAKILAEKAKELDTQGILKAKIQKLLDDIDYLENPQDF